MPHHLDAMLAAVQAAADAGYDRWLDVIRIQDGSTFRDGMPAETLRVQSDDPPYMHLLVKLEHNDRLMRIDVFRNNAEKTAERSLANAKEDVSRRVQTRGEYRRLYKGVVAFGKDKGKEQTWSLEYAP